MMNQFKEYLQSVVVYLMDTTGGVLNTQTLTQEQTNEVHRLRTLIQSYQKCLQENGGTLADVTPLEIEPSPLVKPYYDYINEVCQYMFEQVTFVESGGAGPVTPEDLSQLQLLGELSNQLKNHTKVQAATFVPPVMPIVEASPESAPDTATGLAGIAGLEHIPGIDETSKKDKPRPKWLKPLGIVGNIVFYGLLATLIAVFFLVGDATASEEPANILGFSVMTVLTGSMEGDNPDSIPRGALVLLRRQDDPDFYEVGMVVTFLRERGTTWTHRIVQTIEDHESGQRAFRLQGDANATIDRYVILADQMLGDIVWSSLFLGTAISFIQASPLLSGVFILLLMLLVPTLRKYFQIQREIKKDERAQINQVKKELKFRKKKSA